MWKKIKNLIKKLIPSKNTSNSSTNTTKPKEIKNELEIMAVLRVLLHELNGNYPNLYQWNKSIDYWTNFVTAMAFAESAYNANSVYMEPAPLFYTSNGLLQLSHVDMKNYKECNIDLTGDLIFKIENNLAFGLFILDVMVRKFGNPVSNTSHYWSVLNKTKAGYPRFIKKFNELQGWNK